MFIKAKLQNKLQLPVISDFHTNHDRRYLEVLVVHSKTLPMIAPQCMLEYGSSPVNISHIAMPNEKISTYKR